MAQFVWITAGATTIFEAKNQDEAYRRVIANRLKADGRGLFPAYKQFQ